jgi:hypothetical protein
VWWRNSDWGRAVCGDKRSPALIPSAPASKGAALAWVFAGFIAYQRSGIMTEGLRAGATIALVTMPTAMLTFAFIHGGVALLAHSRCCRRSRSWAQPAALWDRRSHDSRPGWRDTRQAEGGADDLRCNTVQ